MRRALLVVLIALAILPYFRGLGDSAIWDANEAFYVETPRQMIERGDYLNPSFNDAPRFNKPPLSYWIVAGLYAALGVSVEVERLGIAMGALVLIASAFLIGWRSCSLNAGLVAALVLASAPRVVMFARRIFIDVYITMFMGLTLLFLLLAEVKAERRRTWLVLMYASVGLGFLTKGPVAVVLPGIVLLAYLAIQGRTRDLRHFMLPTGAVILGVIIVPWYAALYAEHGWVYIRRFFVEENLLRYAAPYGATAAGRGPLFYVPVLLTDLFPWSVLLPASVYVALRTAWRARARARSVENREASARPSLLLLLWLGVIVSFFSFSQTKQDLYIFPAVTAIACLIGFLLGPAVSAAHDDSPLVRWMLAVAGVVMAVTGAGLLFLFVSPARVYAIAGAWLTSWVLITMGAAATALAVRRRTFQSMVAIGLAAIAVNWILVWLALPSFRQYQPVPALSDAIRARAGADARVGYYRVALPSLVYYLRRPVLELFEPRQLVDTLADGEAYCLITADDYARLAGTLPEPVCVVARAPTFDVKIGNVLARKPPPELLLITNRCE